MKMNHIEIDSVYHLSVASKTGVCWGAGISRGSEGTSVDGDSIQAGKFPVLFYGNNYIENKKRDYRTNKRNSRIIRRLSVLRSGTPTIKNISYTNQGLSPSE